MARRRLTIIVLAAGTAVIVLYGALWLFAANLLDEAVENWATERRAEGWQVGFGTRRMAGFPLRLAHRMEAPSLARVIGGRMRRWRGPKTEIEFQPWRPDEIRLHFPGTHRFELDTTGAARVLTIEAGGADAVLRHEAESGRKTLDMKLNQLGVTDPGSVSRTAIERLSVTVEAIPRTGTDDRGKASTRLVVELGGLVLPAEIKPALGLRIESFVLDAAVIGHIASGPPGEALAAWRDAGGTVELRRLKIVWSDLVLDTDGTLALNADMQPMGAATARITGFRKTVDALVAAGSITPGNAVTTRIVLGLLARTPKEGGPPRITAPLTAQDGALYLGPVKIMRLPRITWR
jgi:hypothetical protein